MRARSFVLFSALGGLCACGEGDPSGDGQMAAIGSLPTTTTAPAPAVVADRFFQAVRSGEEAAVLDCLTPMARAAVEASGDTGFSGEDMNGYELGSAEIEGDTARVPATVNAGGETQNVSLHMRRNSGHWGVSGLGMELGEGAEFVLDLENPDDPLGGIGEAMAEELADSMNESFEQAMLDMQNGGSAEEIAAERAAFEAVTAVDHDEFRHAWWWNGPLPQQPATAAFSRVLQGTDLSIDAGEDTELLERVVQLAPGQGPRLLALEELCRQLGTYPVYPSRPQRWNSDDEWTIQLHPLPRPYPITFRRTVSGGGHRR